MDTIAANIEWGTNGINRISIGNHFWAPKDLLIGIKGLKISPIGEPVYWGLCNLFGWTFYHGVQGVDPQSHSGWTTFMSNIQFVENCPIAWCRQEQIDKDPLLWIYFGLSSGYRKYVLSGYSLYDIAFAGGQTCDEVAGIIGQNKGVAGNGIPGNIFYRNQVFDISEDVREHNRIFFVELELGEIRVNVLTTLNDCSQVRRIYKISPVDRSQKLEIESDEPIEEFYKNNPAYRR